MSDSYSESSSSSSRSVPSFDSTNFALWRFKMNLHLQGIGGSTGVPLSIIPVIHVPIAGVSAAVNESRRIQRERERASWTSAERLCCAAITESVRYDKSATALLFNLFQRRLRELEIAAVAAGLPAPDPLDMSIVTSKELMRELNDQYNVVSSSTLELKDELLRTLKIGTGERTTSYLTRLEHAQGEVICHGGAISQERKEAKLTSGLMNGEEVLSHLAHGLLMSTHTYPARLTKVREFDTTPAGIERLRLNKLKGGKGDVPKNDVSLVGDKIKKKPVKCTGCGKPYHTVDKCWEKHPELKPSEEVLLKQAEKRKAYLAKRGGNVEQPAGKKARFEFPKPAGTVGMVSTEEEVLSVEESNRMVDRVFFDTCCGGPMWLLKEKQWFTKMSKADFNLGVADKDGTLRVAGVGEVAGQTDVYFCPNVRQNLVGQGRIHMLNLTYSSPPNSPPVFADLSKTVVLTGDYFRCMPHFDLAEFIEYIDSQRTVGLTTVAAVGDVFPERPLKLWHARLGHINVHRVIDMCRLQAVDGLTLHRSDMSGKSRKAAELPCSTCQLIKSHRVTFHKGDHLPDGVLVAGDMIVCDIHIFMNKPSREGYCYVINFTDLAARKTWSYLAQEKAEFLAAAKHLLNFELQPRAIIWKRFHSDSDSVVLSNDSTQWFESMHIIVTTSPTDTPELNGHAEAVNKWLGIVTMSTLTPSGLDSTFWADAYLVANKIKGYVPVETARGWMSPDMFINGVKPNIHHLRVFGCLCVVHEPRSESRKDWHPPNVAGRLIGYSEPHSGAYVIWIPELTDVCISVNVTFDEDIPDRATEYFRGLSGDLAPIADQDREVAEFKYLVGKCYIDDENGLWYEITKVGKNRQRLIIGYVRRVLPGRRGAMERAPIHIADLERMYRATEGRTPTALVASVDDLHISPIMSVSDDRFAALQGVSGVYVHADVPKDIMLALEESKLESEWTSFGQKDHDSGVVSNVTEVAGPHLQDAKCAADASAPDVDKDTDLPPGKERFPPRMPETLNARAVPVPADAKPYFSACYTDPEEDYAMLIEHGYTCLTSGDAPLTRAEMLSGPDRAAWLAAEEKEIRSIEEREVIESVVDIPPGVRPIGTRWLYKVKDNITRQQEDSDKTERVEGTFAKARIVAQGFSQIHGFDVADLYAPTGKNVVFRLLLIIMLVFGLVSRQIDVDTAFLYATLKVPVYLNAFPGYPLPAGKCLKAIKALYGLRNSPKAWFDTMRDFIIGQGFTQSILDRCLYFKRFDNSIILIMVYVDDILLFAKDEDRLDKLVAMFNARFKCKDLGQIKRFIGIDVHITESTVKLSQEPYAKKCTDKFKEWWVAVFPEDKPRKMPLPADTPDRIADEHIPDEFSAWFQWWTTFPYLSVIGALLYLAMNSRPDLMFAICMLARYSKKKTLQSCYLLCHVLSYLSGTLAYHILYDFELMGISLEELMHAFSDADWAGDRATRRSTAGFLIFMLGAPISWSSKLMSTIATSTMESEYMAAFHCAQEILFIRNLLRELGIVLKLPTLMLMDAQAAIDSIHSEKFSARVKHMDVKWRILQQMVVGYDGDQPVLRIVHVPSADMKADILTKAVTYIIWCRLVIFLMSGM